MAVNGWVAPTVTVTGFGATTMVVSVPRLKVTCAVALNPPCVAVMVLTPVRVELMVEVASPAKSVVSVRGESPPDPRGSVVVKATV